MENEKNPKEMKGGKTDVELYFQIGVIAILVLVIAFNLGKTYGNSETRLAKGVPAVYGEELGVSYDDVSADNPGLADATIQKLTAYEDMQLDNATMTRYIRIGGSISCEYCCGAKSIIFTNGQRACGCAHSYAMRGLAKYLLTNHPDMTDIEILSELGKWKVLFFPGVNEKKAKALEANGIDSTDYINLASNLYRGIEQGKTSGGGMVGGC